MTKVIGIDPGMNGGIAWFRDELRVAPMPDTVHELAELLREIKEYATPPTPIKAYLELATPMPKQGIASTGKFMRGFGEIEGILAALQIPYQLVRAGVWQRSLGCLSGGDKKVTKRMAGMLFPWMKPTHKTADALLIYEYGRRIENTRAD